MSVLGGDMTLTLEQMVTQDSTKATWWFFSRARTKTYNSQICRTACTKPQFLKTFEKSQKISCNQRLYERNDSLILFSISVFSTICNSGSYQQCLKYFLENKEKVVSANSFLPLKQTKKQPQKQTFCLPCSGKGWPCGDQGEQIFQEGIL